jgi:signal transduction histidine kinase
MNTARAAEKRASSPAYLLLGLVWTLFLSSALEQKHLSWFPLLFSVRTAEALSAFILFVLSFFRPTGRLLPLYLTLCAIAQSTFSVLEGPSALEYFQYLPYFTLLNVLAFDGDFKSWIRQHGWVHLLTMVIPLATKDPGYFGSLGKFVYQFTTPVAVVALSLLVLRIVSEKNLAIRSTLQLKSELLVATEKLNSKLDEELSKAKEKLLEGERLRVLTQLALEVSHDIRSPVAALSALEKNLPPGFPESDRDLLKHALERIQNIANQLLDSNRAEKTALLRSENEESSPEAQSVSDIAHFLRNLIAEKRLEYASSEGVEFSFESSVGATGIRTALPPNALGRILSNLINNSVEAMNGRGFIRTTLAQPSSTELEIVVADNGMGMSLEVLSVVRKGSASHGKVKGSGIGLQQARARLEAVNGKIHIESEVGRGTRVTLAVPILQG